MEPFLSDRTFGVEIEVFHFPYGFFLPIDNGVMPVYRLPHALVKDFEGAGLRLGGEEDTWRFTQDSTILGGRGVELQSPPLKGEEGLKRVRAAMDILRSHGARVNGSCGFHVHHHAPDFGPRELASLLELMFHWEPLIYGAIPGNRERRKSSCRPLPSEILDALRSGKKEPLTMDDLEGLWYGEDAPYGKGERYHDSRNRGLNLHSYWFRGTVEFRYMKGTLDGKVAERWILFTHRLMEAARDRKEGLAGLSVYFNEWKAAVGSLE